MIKNQPNLAHVASITKSQPSQAKQPHLIRLAKNQPNLT
jgi:hypothetical protein